tara:strand:+ start:10326 stop:10850 length:525 start_codon:yes stop_codon:yes gene_type:complete
MKTHNAYIKKNTSDYYNIATCSSLVLSFLCHYFKETDKPIDMGLIYYILPIVFSEDYREAINRTKRKTAFLYCIGSIKTVQEPLKYLGHLAVSYKTLTSLSISFLIENDLITIVDSSKVSSTTDNSSLLIERLSRQQKREEYLIQDRYKATEKLAIKLQLESEQRITSLTGVSL